MPPLAADISTVERAGGRNDIRLLPQGSETSAAFATAVSLRRALLLPVQPKRFELDSAGASRSRAMLMPRGKRPSTAARTSLGARKASEMVMLT